MFHLCSQKLEYHLCIDFWVMNMINWFRMIIVRNRNCLSLASTLVHHRCFGVRVAHHFSFLCCVVLWARVAHHFSFLCCVLGPVLLIFLVFCVVFSILFVFVLFFVPTFPVSLECLFLIILSVFSNVYLYFRTMFYEW